ncbi:hypothetical protein CIHG_04690 [Coccidioides immitis H538.4]|uniref:Uncharacterized protein n=1 Tax=Coccidioides immitis H538.4 TaxID=396776 RepID=A0A0J8RRM7_COCIT|nr:hypothetical protein CIHG_04690 [Coccidioides immitis H538.4]
MARAHDVERLHALNTFEERCKANSSSSSSSSSSIPHLGGQLITWCLRRMCIFPIGDCRRFSGSKRLGIQEVGDIAQGQDPSSTRSMGLSWRVEPFFVLASEVLSLGSPVATDL